MSNLSWENIKLACLDEKVLSKPALTAKAMWNREANSEDDLDLTYKVQNKNTREHQYVLEPSFNTVPADGTGINTQQNIWDTRQCTTTNPGKQRAKHQSDTSANADTITLESSDEEFDRLLLKKFPIGAHLPLSYKPCDLKKLKESFLTEKTNNFEYLRTRKPIRPRTNQEKQNTKRAPIIFLKDRFKGPAHTINPKAWLRLEHIARKTGTIARKIKIRGNLGHNSELSKMAR